MKTIFALAAIISSYSAYAQNIRSPASYIINPVHKEYFTNHSTQYNVLERHNAEKHIFLVEKTDKSINGKDMTGLNLQINLFHNFTISAFNELNIEQKKMKKRYGYSFKKGYTDIDLEYRITNRISMMYSPSGTGKKSRRNDMGHGLGFSFRL